MSKKIIHYQTYESNFKVYLFFPGGQWDEFKWSYEEAVKQYPKEEFTWVLQKEN